MTMKKDPIRKKIVGKERKGPMKRKGRRTKKKPLPEPHWFETRGKVWTSNLTRGQ